MVNNDVNGWFGGLPSLSSLEKPDPDLSSELISADGVSLGKYYRKNRTPVTYRELSPELINTLLVTEDYRFKQHSGIDLRGLARAVIGKITFNFQGGGSTLTMQLAENLYKTNSSNNTYNQQNIYSGEVAIKHPNIQIQQAMYFGYVEHFRATSTEDILNIRYFWDDFFGR